MGWQEIATLPGENLRKITPDIEPISYALGILGMPGLTAYFSLLEIGKPKSGETVVVSAASGAVGSVVGQLAKSYGCRVIGIVGNELKSEYITKKLGFDGAINYRLYENIKAPLRELCPDGVDIYFDNVGGGITDAVMNSLAFRARIIVCGMISEYNLEKAYIGPSHLRSILVSRARVEGFLVFDWADRYSEGITNLKKMLDDDMLTYSEDIVEGIENAPSGFLELFSGKNLGKRLVRLSQ
jgi:NADPH-dependent curcumin reductase CurA